MQPPTGERPRFTIVSAVYNVSRYLEDFIASLERQTFDLSRLEVIMVDDGSTDDSAEVLHRWRERRPDLVQVVTKANGGQGSARNLGMTMATGEWITFLDPDDMIGEPYLANVDRFLADNPIVGYAARKGYVQLLFWSGRAFDEPGLTPEGSFQAAELRLTDVTKLPTRDLARWLRKARVRQWDYKNIVKRRGVLEKLGTWT